MAGELKRGLTRVDLVSITLNSVIGAGIFTMPAALAAGAGNLSLVALLGMLVLVGLIALCMAEVASRYDVTGGPVVYVSSAFGPFPGFIVGWLMYLSRLATFGAIAVTMLDYGAGLWPPLESTTVRVLVTTLFVGAITFVNIRGVVRGAWTGNVLLALKLLPLALLAVAGLWLVWGTPLPLPEPSGLNELGAGFLIAFYAFMGFEQSTVVAGESRNPRRDMPIGLLAGIAIVGLLYSLLLITCMHTVADLGAARRPRAGAAAALVGAPGATLVALTAVVSCAGTLSVWMVASPRVIFALAAQGELPRALSNVHTLRGTPYVAILASAFLVWLLTISGTFIYLATFSALTRLLVYAASCAALPVLRKREGPAPVAIPFGRILAVLAVLLALGVITTTSVAALRDVAIALALGLGLRWFVRSRSRSAEQSAL
jgi:amino acid transporter